MTEEPRTLLADGRALTTEELGPLVYDDLRRMADALFRRERNVTLQPTALVHEAYLRLAAQDKQTWENRAQFLAVAARAMRRVLVSSARARGRLKRGGGWERVTLGTAADGAPVLQADLLDLDAALARLEQVKERYVRIVELIFFAGMTLEEAGRVLGISRTMVSREWVKAQAWLATQLQDLREDGG
ncbi:MAG: ECF-type sigma factor [Planctomycetota bacterium]